MPDPARAYSRSTRAALFALAGGTCYFPNCDEAVIKHIVSGPEIMVDIAHVRGANPNSKRYDPTMTDQERAAFANLILLCRAHHNLVDRDEVAYSVPVLTEWKRYREQASGERDYSTLKSVSEGDLEGLLLDAVRGMAPKREVEVDLDAALPVSGRGDGVVCPFSLVHHVREGNPSLVFLPLRIRANVRNVGSLKSYVVAFDLMFDVTAVPGHSPGTVTFAGTNEFPGLNPALPRLLEDGNSMSWFWTGAPVLQTAAGTELAGAPVEAMFARVRLASGEEIDSPRVPWPEVHDAVSSVVAKPFLDPRHEERRSRWSSGSGAPGE